MKKLATALMVTSALMASGTAHADEGGYSLSKGFGIGGIVTGLAIGPAVTIGATVATVNSAVNNATGSGSTSGLTNGATGILVGVGLTGIAPAVVVGSSFAGNLAVKDMGGSPALTGAIIGASGVGLQALGWVMSVSAWKNLKPAGAGTALRWTGWSTAMVGGVVQMAGNGKAYRGLGTASLDDRGHFTMTFVPSINGAGVVGTF